MTYEASPEILSLIEGTQKGLKRNFYFIVFVLLVYAYPMYGICDRKFGIEFFATSLFLIVMLLILNRAQTVPSAIAMSKTAIEVSIFENYLLIKTPPIHVLFWINKPAEEHRFNIREFSRRQVVYPVRRIYDLDNKVWKLDTGKDAVYVLTDFFDVAFKDELEKFLYWKDVH